MTRAGMATSTRMEPTTTATATVMTIMATPMVTSTAPHPRMASPGMCTAPIAATTMPITTTPTTTIITSTGITTITTATATSMAEQAPLPLLVWLSPAFPVGAFAYSHGLEWAVEQGDLHDAASVQAWIDDLLALGSGRNDANLLAEAHRAASAGDRPRLAGVAELGVALQPSRERHLEATAQGNAFLAAARASWPAPALDLLSESHEGDVVYPVAIGVAAAGHGVALRPTLEAFLLAFVAALVSAAVRLGPIGQTDGQRVTAALLPRIRDTACFAEASSLDDLGGAAFRSDIASLRHETQYTRLFRS
jgi:urease accessory protein